MALFCGADRVRDGEAADVVIASVRQIEALEKQGKVVAAAAQTDGLHDHEGLIEIVLIGDGIAVARWASSSKNGDGGFRHLAVTAETDQLG